MSLFISTQFFILNLDGWFDVLSDESIIFWYSIITLYYVSLRSSIIFCLFAGDIYLSLGTSVSFSTASEVFCGGFPEIL